MIRIHKAKENCYQMELLYFMISSLFFQGKCDQFQLFGFHFVSFTSLLSVSSYCESSSPKCNKLKDT